MTIQTFSTLRTNMPVGVTGAISAQDMQDFIDTTEDATSQTILSKSGNYTAVLADNRRKIIFTAAATLTLPNTLPVGWECGIIQMTTGQVTISVQTGGTGAILSRGNLTKTAGLYAQAYVVVVTNTNGTAAQICLGGDIGT